MAYDASNVVNYQYVNVKKVMQEALEAEAMRSGQREVRIFTSDPIDAASIPCIGINKTNLNEQGESSGLGRVARPPSWNAETKEYTTYSGGYMNESVEVRIFHTNADERDKLAIFALAVMYVVRNSLEALGLTQCTISGGRDEQDNNLLGDRVLYMHTLSMNYLNPLDVTVTTITEAVEGIDVITAIMP